MVVELFLRSGRNTCDHVKFGMAQNSPEHHCPRPDRPLWAGQKRSGISNFVMGFSCFFLSLLSKRDATCYVDGLALPKHLRRFFGRPPIIAGAVAPLSCFNEVYSFARQPDKRALPPICVSELFAAVLILLQIRIDLQRPWVGLFCATDASQACGFGAQLQPSVFVERGKFRVCRIGVMIWCGSNVTRMFSMSQNAVAHGVAHHVGIPKSCFKTIICQRARFEAHPGALEGA